MGNQALRVMFARKFSHLSDGSSFALNNGGCMDVVFDINGEKLPNSWGRDQFVFYFCLDEAQRLQRCGNLKKVFGL